uniref:Uncharacterized protein n=1 Tax=Rhizophora mucronata TaxID=61149 RepID=A0A2P2PEB4_RHIMU
MSYLGYISAEMIIYCCVICVADWSMILVVRGVLMFGVSIVAKKG